jgi:hypothetical protein
MGTESWGSGPAGITHVGEITERMATHVRHDAGFPTAISTACLETHRFRRRSERGRQPNYAQADLHVKCRRVVLVSVHQADLCFRLRPLGESLSTTATATPRMRRCTRRRASSGRMNSVPQGGDELNVLRPSANSGWLVSPTRDRIRDRNPNRRRGPRGKHELADLPLGAIHIPFGGWPSIPPTSFQGGGAICSSGA